MITVDENWEVLCQKAFELFEEGAPQNLPEYGKFFPFAFQLQYPQSDYLGLIQVIYDDENPRTQRIVNVGVRHSNSYRLISHFIFKGTRQEILDWMKTEEALIETVKSLKELKDKAEKE